MIRRVFLFAFSLVALSAFRSVDAINVKEQPFEKLYTFMSGSFSSELQSQSDSDYFDIRLRMVPIWQRTENQFYLYVEQAMSTAQDKPYRQRVYRVVKMDDTHFTSYIYTIPGPERCVGKEGSDLIFTLLTADSLVAKDGCEVNLTYDAVHDVFNGSTGNQTCPSDRAGAKWATSKVTIDARGMESWDQGWNAEGKQVWGATKGGYKFLRR